MTFSNAKKLLNTLKQVLKLSFIEIKFSGYNEENRENYQQTFKCLTAPHPRFKIIKHKVIGVALFDLSRYKDFPSYYQSVNGKNSAAYYSRKAIKNQFVFKEIERNDYIHDIHVINNSSEYRQGKKMPCAYTDKKDHYSHISNYRYFGVLDTEGRLVSYCYVAFYGEFAFITNILGHKHFLNYGIMYLMMLEINKLMLTSYRENGLRFVMYDTYFGASEGLKKFKQKLGFQPFHVKWLWQD
ncbi:MAG: hypothetical protein NTV00_09795 [Methylococcales bacterium]|nr:hypothetical protein [Methylococcales bacterium]